MLWQPRAILERWHNTSKLCLDIYVTLLLYSEPTLAHNATLIHLEQLFVDEILFFPRFHIVSFREGTRPTAIMLPPQALVLFLHFFCHGLYLFFFRQVLLSHIVQLGF